MKSPYVGAAFGFACAVAIAIAASSLQAHYRYCPNGSATAVTALCQTFDSAGGNAVARSEALQVGLLLPYLQPATETESETQLALNRTSNAPSP
jgi:hypothetical protein